MSNIPIAVIAEPTTKASANFFCLSSIVAKQTGARTDCLPGSDASDVHAAIR
jgi:hypothetical protein